jgi:prostaglandin-H2 D-isomerase / glutathione transferase
MPTLKLTYFDFHGGRGEPARLALSIGGIPFVDDRVAPSHWERRKPKTPFGTLPVLEVDGQTLAQSNAINRYVGKLTDLYPTDAWQAALCDEVLAAAEDINTKLAATLFLPDEEKKTQRKALVDSPVPLYLSRLQQRLEAHGGQYFAALHRHPAPRVPGSYGHLQRDAPAANSFRLRSVLQSSAHAFGIR